MGRRQTACRACAAIKGVCSKQAPCARCKRLSLQCSLGTYSVPSYDSATAHQAVGSRIRHPKSSTGCRSCQIRRKKCDESHPVCGDCSRLGLQCIPREGNVPLSMTSGNNNGEALPGTSPGRRASDHLEGAVMPSFDWISVIDEEYQTESSTKGTSLANSSALDVQPEGRASDDIAADDSISLPSTALGNLAGITPASLQGWTIGERHLLNHFLQYVARSLVLVEDDENPFIASIVPMALDNDTVRHALLALSACHLSRIYPDFERNLLRHRSLALLHLKAELETSRDTTRSLAATLLLCLLEVLI
jgi:transcriptional activator protein UGA3